MNCPIGEAIPRFKLHILQTLEFSPGVESAVSVIRSSQYVIKTGTDRWSLDKLFAKITAIPWHSLELVQNSANITVINTYSKLFVLPLVESSVSRPAQWHHYEKGKVRLPDLTSSRHEGHRSLKKLFRRAMAASLNRTIQTWPKQSSDVIDPGWEFSLRNSTCHCREFGPPLQWCRARGGRTRWNGTKKELTTFAVLVLRAHATRNRTCTENPARAGRMIQVSYFFVGSYNRFLKSISISPNLILTSQKSRFDMIQFILRLTGYLSSFSPMYPTIQSYAFRIVSRFYIQVLLRICVYEMSLLRLEACFPKMRHGHCFTRARKHTPTMQYVPGT
jgi:hypothetical protein